MSKILLRTEAKDTYGLTVAILEREVDPLTATPATIKKIMNDTAKLSGSDWHKIMLGTVEDAPLMLGRREFKVHKIYMRP
jgi:hypothetical protein